MITTKSGRAAITISLSAIGKAGAVATLLAVGLTGCAHAPTAVTPAAVAEAAPPVTPEPAPFVGDPVVGQAIAQRDCGGCHAIAATGESPLAGAPRFRELHRSFDVEFLGEALAEGIVVGHGPMPMRSYEPEDIQSLIAYLKSLETTPATPG